MTNKTHLLNVLVGNQGKTALTVRTVLLDRAAVVDRTVVVVVVVDRAVVDRAVVVVDTTVADIEIHYYLYWRCYCE